MDNQLLRTPEFITYASTQQSCDLAIQHGATHIILEDPLLSIRSWHTEQYTSFSNLNFLISYLKTTYPSIIISIQCDIIMHAKHESLIDSFITFIHDQPIDYIRVQDSGLLILFNQKLSQINCIFLQEMGNANAESIQVYSRYSTRQSLSLDLPYKDIQLIQTKVSTSFDCLIQGKYLIQHSPRRFLAGLDPEVDSPEHIKSIHRIAQDEDYPGRRFVFLDNPHGHFMFAYFDRSLANYIPELISLNLSGWIIDARGESDDYLCRALSFYISHYHSYMQSSNDWHVQENELKRFYDTCERPQRPGFFRANQTDRDRYNPRFLNDEQPYKVVGKVIDVIKGKRITIDCTQSFKKGIPLHAFHPKIKSLACPSEQIWDLSGNVLETVSAPQVIQIPWVKGIQQQAVIGILTDTNDVK